MSRDYIDEAAQVPVEIDPDWTSFKTRRELEAPDFELLPGRWALITPALVLDAKKYAKLKKDAKNVKRGTKFFYDEKLGMLIVPKIHSKSCVIETILESTSFKTIPVEDNLLAIVDNSELGSGRNPNAVRFTAAKSIAGYVVPHANGKIGIELWGEGYGRNLVDAYCG